MNGQESSPDTLDLTDRAKLAQGYLINNPDVKRGYQPYFSGSLLTQPATYSHSSWDFGDVTGRFVEAFILNRMMVGDNEGEEVEQGIRRFILSLFREDGLSYRGAIKDWDPKKEGDMFFWDQGRVLYGLVTWYLREKDEGALRHIRAMTAGLRRVAVHERDYAYFPYESMFGGKYVERPDLSQTLWAASGQVIEPLVRHFEETGDEEAMAFAGQLARGLLKAPVHFFEPDGAFTLHELPYHYAFHLHSHTAALIGLLRYGMATRDRELVSIGQRGYDWIKARGSTSIGWTCEHYPYKTLWDDGQEVCGMTDLLTLAILLAEAGYERYWNDVERIARNHLVESQLVSTESFEPFRVGLKHLLRKIDPVEDGWCSYDRVADRAVGGTDGGGWANELYRPAGMGVSGCCSPHMIKGFYLAWSHIVTRLKGELRLNLGLNFISPWMEVRSYLPYQGKLEITVLEDTSLSVRVPDWVPKSNVAISRAGRKTSFDWKGDYARLERVTRGQTVVVQYPLRQSWIREDVGTASFDFKWRGDTVVEVKPKGMVMPTYQRGFMDRDEAPARSLPTRRASEGFHVW